MSDQANYFGYDTRLLHRPSRIATAKTSLSAIASASKGQVRVIVVVEGQHDVEFLRRLSRKLNVVEPNIPDLGELEAHGELVFLPTGGGDLESWSQRLAPLGCAEFHLYDREQSPETELRQHVVAKVKQRPRCHAALTSKRTLENYLHPDAIERATGITLAFTDHDDIAALFAQHCLQQRHPQLPWEQLPRRARKRLANQAKRALNGQAVEHMSLDLLAESDAAGEVRAWYRAIQQLANGRCGLLNSGRKRGILE